MNISYLLAKIIAKISKNHQFLVNYYRKKGIKIGDNCLICSNIITREPGLIEIGSNVTISTNVSLVTHDNSIKLLFPDKSDLFGRIKIGNNCFIGENSIILYGCELGDNVIVAAGSVVTKSFHQKNIVIGGNPAHIISDWDTLKNKYKHKAALRNEIQKDFDANESLLVKR